jgi:hypothetical protein
LARRAAQKFSSNFNNLLVRKREKHYTNKPLNGINNCCAILARTVARTVAPGAVLSRYRCEFLTTDITTDQA